MTTVRSSARTATVRARLACVSWKGMREEREREGVRGKKEGC